jgi:hypothetical protein
MGRACRKNVRYENCIQNSSRKRKWGRDHFGDPGIDGRIILKCILKK